MANKGVQMKNMPTGEWIIYMLDGVRRNGHTLKEVLAYDDTQFDIEHDFMQWALPNKVPSSVNFDAPILLDQDIEFYHQSNALRQECALVDARFLKSLGILRVAFRPLFVFNNTEFISGSLIKSADFKRLSCYWLCGHSHHHLRITRYINFNIAMGNHAQCEQLLEFIRHEIKELLNPPRIALNYWEQAVFKK
jgi:hypothetical protein